MSVLDSIWHVLAEWERAGEPDCGTDAEQIPEILERLANLLPLAQSTATSSDPQIAAALERCHRALHAKISSTSLTITLNSARKLEEQMLRILAGNAFPLGCSVSLQEKLATIRLAATTIDGGSTDEHTIILCRLDALHTQIASIDAALWLKL